MSMLEPSVVSSALRRSHAWKQHTDSALHVASAGSDGQGLLERLTGLQRFTARCVITVRVHMAKRDKWEEPVEVPAVVDMEDETFLKHLEHRHAHEVDFQGGRAARMAVEAWVGVYRAFHDRLHRLATPGQYDHEHEEEW